MLGIKKKKPQKLPHKSDMYPYSIVRARLTSTETLITRIRQNILTSIKVENKMKNYIFTKTMTT